MNRPHYHFVEKYVSRINECGRQCLFLVPSKSEIDMDSLNKDIDFFRFVMDWNYKKYNQKSKYYSSWKNIWLNLENI